MVSRVWPRHGQRGRPLNSIVRSHANASRHDNHPRSAQISVPGSVRDHPGRSGIGGLGSVGAAVRSSRRSGIRDNGASVVSDAHIIHRANSERVETPFHTSAEMGSSLSGGRAGASLWVSGVALGGVTSNNAFERTARYRGPRLAAAQRWWPAAQLGRYAS
jgi:hypothetical protein